MTPKSTPARPRRPAPAPIAVVGVQPDPRPARRIERELRTLLAGGAEMLPAGEARRDPELLLRRAPPRHSIRLFGAVWYLSDFLFDDQLNFLVAYFGRRERAGGVLRVWPRLYYKDSSLLWRVASHVIPGPDGYWIGKGDVRRVTIGGEEHFASDEDSTNLPYEIQGALDEISRRSRPRRDEEAVALVLRAAPPGRIEPYADFTRERLRAEARAPIHGGRPVARISRRGDPRSLSFAPGYEPDLRGGILELTHSASRLYHGRIEKYRVRSTNGLVQYQLVHSPTHAWINPPQAFTTELTPYGLRALHVRADEEIFVPGYEYHFLDTSQDPPEPYSQIPPGYAGEPSPIDPDRADASAWIEALPVIRAFRREVLGEAERRRRKA